jgi:hypothetical protein
MEYSTLYDILYKTLYDTFPKVIIDHIIFKYAVNSCTYEYKYSIPCTELFSNVHLNKQLGIILCESNKSFKFIDYHSGEEHDRSLINTTSCGLHYNDFIILFDNDIILTRHITINKYIISNKQYVKTSCNYIDIDSSYCIKIHESFIYMLHKNKTHYNIIVYDLEHLNKICESQTYECHDGTLQLSIYDDCIYIYECDYIHMITRMYIHDVNTFHRTLITRRMYTHGIHTFHMTLSHNYAILYKNKLYYYNLGKIYVYDTNTFEQIYSFDVNQCRKNINYCLNISDDIILLSNSEHMIFYHIKKLKCTTY